MSTFDDFTPGSVFRAGPRPVGEEEIIDFARRYDPQPFDIDRQQAAASRWGRPVRPGDELTLCITVLAWGISAGRSSA
jgi:acyl dehydratase